jgi:DnaJ-class molecular chaperone
MNTFDTTLHALTALDPLAGRREKLAKAFETNRRINETLNASMERALPGSTVRWTKPCVPCGGTGQFLEDAHQDEVRCTFCDGTGNIRINNDPQHDRDCSVCEGAGQLPQAQLDKAEFEAAEAAQAFDPDARGDWEFHQER